MGRITYPFLKAFDGDAKPLVGGRVHTYGPGTVINIASYADHKKTQYGKNPIILNADGEARIYLDGYGPLGGGSPVKIVTKDSDGSTISTTNSVTNAAQAPPEARSDTFKAYDKEGNPLRDTDSTTYVASFEPSEKFTDVLLGEAR